MSPVCRDLFVKERVLGTQLWITEYVVMRTGIAALSRERSVVGDEEEKVAKGQRFVEL